MSKESDAFKEGMKSAPSGKPPDTKKSGLPPGWPASSKPPSK
jgi:hypothetical protein